MQAQILLDPPPSLSCSPPLSSPSQSTPSPSTEPAQPSPTVLPSNPVSCIRGLSSQTRQPRTILHLGCRTRRAVQVHRVTVAAREEGETSIRRFGAHFREGSQLQSLFAQQSQLHKTTDAPGHTSHIQPKDEINVIRINLVRMTMFPEAVPVPNSISYLFGHKDGTDGGVSIPKSE